MENIVLAMKKYTFDTEQKFISECFGMEKDNYSKFITDLTRFIVAQSILANGEKTKVASLQHFLSETDLTQYNFPETYQDFLIGMAFITSLRLTNEFFSSSLSKEMTSGRILGAEKEEKLTN